MLGFFHLEQFGVDNTLLKKLSFYTLCETFIYTGRIRIEKG